ncbi:MAG: hypothetical protein ACPGVU_15950 [Limisphaerales bacterium]
MNRQLYCLKYAFWECVPISWYGERLRDKFISLATSGKVWLASAMNMLTFFVLILTVSIVTGLYTGGVAWLKDFLIGFKAARAIELKAIKGQEGRPFTPALIATIAELQTPGGHRPLGAFGWNGVQLWFYDANGSKYKTIDNGRTVEPDDLILETVEFLESNTIKGWNRRCRHGCRRWCSRSRFAWCWYTGSG